MSFIVAALPFRELLFEAPTLLFWIIQFAEGVSDLETSGKYLEALDPVRFIPFVLRQWRYRYGKVVENRGLPKMFLGNRFEHVGDGFARRFGRIERHMRSMTRVQTLD